jgi:hypothetical protein
MLHVFSLFKFEQKKSALRARDEGGTIQKAEFSLETQQENADVTFYKKCYM